MTTDRDTTWRICGHDYPVHVISGQRFPFADLTTARDIVNLQAEWIKSLERQVEELTGALTRSRATAGHLMVAEDRDRIRIAELERQVKELQEANQ